MGKFSVFTPKEELECARKMVQTFDALVEELLRAPFVWRFLFERWERIKSLGRASNKLAEEYGNSNFSADELTRQVDENITAAMNLAGDDLHMEYEMYDHGRIAFHLKNAGISKTIYLDLAKTVLESNISDSKKERITQLKKETDHYRHALINANLRLVITFSKRFNGYGIDLPDLIQEGNIGLMRAAEKFDPSRQFKFSTYAAHWIRQSFIKVLKRQGKTIRLPSHIYDTLGKLKRAHEDLYLLLNREPTTKELSEILEVDPALIERISSLRAEPLSLEAPVQALSHGGDHAPKYLKDFIEDDTIDPLDCISKSRRDEAVLKVVRAVLSPIEQQVILYRFGLGAHPPHTLEQIANVLGKSRERIRQVESSALNKLRENARFLEEYNE